MRKLFIVLTIFSICQIARAVDTNNLDPNLYLQKIKELEQTVKALQQKIDQLTIALENAKKENERLNALCKKAGPDTIKASEEPIKNKTAGEVEKMSQDWVREILPEQEAAKKAGLNTMSVELFYKVFGKPKKKMRMGDSYYFYYDCKDGTVTFSATQKLVDDYNTVDPRVISVY